MKKLLVLLSLMAAFQASWASLADTVELKPKPVYGREARVISYILDSYHYRKIALNDSLSAAILQHYFNELDNNRSYFLASDIQSFDKYKFAIDDLTRKEDVSPAYAIYKVFRQRYTERMEYIVKDLIGTDFDYTIDENYDSDRDKQPWAATLADLNDVWRKVIKSQALSLKLAGKKQEENNAVVPNTYVRLAKALKQS